MLRTLGFGVDNVLAIFTIALRSAKNPLSLTMLRATKGGSTTCLGNDMLKQRHDKMRG